MQKRKLILKKGPIQGILRVVEESHIQCQIVNRNDDDDYDSSDWWSDECGVVE